MQTSETPFRLAGNLSRVPAIGPLLLGLAERALAFERLANIHRQAAGGDKTTTEFAMHALEIMQVNFALDPAQLERIPAAGPAVVVANHPYGGIEGLFLIAALLKHRSDSRLIANQLLGRIPELRDAIIPVDVFGGASAARENFRGLRHALKHVQKGGLIMVFPAGTVSHLHLSAGRVCDPPWNASVARLLRMCGCPVTPIHFGGGNSAIFQTLGLLHPRMRTAMLSRELLNKRHRVIPVTIGRPIPAELIAEQHDDAALASFLRLSTYALEARSLARRKVSRHQAEIDAAVPATLLEAEIQCLQPAQTLATSGDACVLFARTSQIPWVLREIGRQREIAFRAVGEGTGRGSDLDKYDEHYVHAIAWHQTNREIAGAYRIGHVDQILARSGRQGLYTHSLFSYGDPFLRALGPALELGRSFVSRDYQKSFGTLLLLWKGIAGYVHRNPRYHVLFGPVSVSGEYRPHSHALLIDFLKRRCYDTRLAQLIRARKPFRRTHSLAALNGDLARLGDLEELSSLVEAMEPDGKGLPILLKQYLKLGARLVGFNVDAGFGDVVDGMIVVDLLRTDERALQKYMGREQAAAFLASHRPGGSAAS
jgi:putative hemolysin